MTTITIDPATVEATIARAKAVFADRSNSTPRERQKAMALLVTAQFHGPEAAVAAQLAAESIAAGRDTAHVEAQVFPLADLEFPLQLSCLLVRTGICASTTRARQLIKDGAVKLDGERLSNFTMQFDSPELLNGRLLSVGKKTFRRLAA